MWWTRQERSHCYSVSKYGGGLLTGRGFPTDYYNEDVEVLE